MTRAAVLKLLGAAAGLAIVVTLISPPTRPVPTPAGDWRKQLPVKTGVSPPAASTATVPAAALARRSPPVQPKIEEANKEQAAQTGQSLDQLESFAARLRDQEAGGKRFTAEDADTLGRRAQDQAEAIAGQITQAAKQLNIELET